MGNMLEMGYGSVMWRDFGPELLIACALSRGDVVVMGGMGSVVGILVPALETKGRA